MKKISLAAILICGTLFSASAQMASQPYSYSFYQKLNRDMYNVNTKTHSSLKPLFIGDSLLIKADSIMAGYAVGHGVLSRRFFNNHQAEVKKENYTLYADFLPDITIGRDGENDKTTWLRSFGYRVGGTISDKLSFHTSGFFNKAKLPGYYSRYTQEHKVLPGQRHKINRPDSLLTDEADWNYFTGHVSYTPIKYINIQAGYDKNFIGDGYRSLLLSDFGSPYPFLKLTGTLGSVRYMAMWSALQDPSAPRFENADRKKGAVFHYLDWNITKRLSVGFFDAVVWATHDSVGNKRGFDPGYASPIIFLRPVESDGGSPDNAVMGFTAKYELFDKMAVYGQFALDEFQAKEFFSGNGSSRNKWGVQLGVRGADLLKIPHLNYLLEFNTARPYTFSERIAVVNYAHYNEPLGHPYGANFRETIGMLNYSIKRFEISTQLLYSRYGRDFDGLNYGKDLFKPYTKPARDEGNYIGQGLGTDLYYTDTRVAFLLNPAYNLRLEAGLVTRNEKNRTEKNNTTLFTFGLRTSFRNLYQDF